MAYVCAQCHSRCMKSRGQLWSWLIPGLKLRSSGLCSKSCTCCAILTPAPHPAPNPPGRFFTTALRKNTSFLLFSLSVSSMVLLWPWRPPAQAWHQAQVSGCTCSWLAGSKFPVGQPPPPAWWDALVLCLCPCPAHVTHLSLLASFFCGVICSLLLLSTK